MLLHWVLPYHFVIVIGYQSLIMYPPVIYFYINYQNSSRFSSSSWFAIVINSMNTLRSFHNGYEKKTAKEQKLFSWLINLFVAYDIIFQLYILNRGTGLYSSSLKWFCSFFQRKTKFQKISFISAFSVYCR